MTPKPQDLAEDAPLTTDEATVTKGHPLDPLSRNEIVLAAKIVKAELAPTVGNNLRFETIELSEPPKESVRAGLSGERKARVTAFAVGGGVGVYCLIVSLTSETVLSQTFEAKARPMIALDEFVDIENCVKKDERVIEACKKRGITDMGLVCIDPWSSGMFGFDYEEDRHLSYTFMWVRSGEEDDNLYAHPVDGVNAVVDIKAMEVVHVDDWGIIPVPEASSNYDSKFIEKTRSDLKPINVSQPEGVSFTLEGRTLKWHDWSIFIGFNAREGISLHNMSYAGRPVCYRASIVEMVVPYGSPRAPHYRKNVFDIGEYGLGKLANSLQLGCDCLGVIQYLDCWINGMNGEPICIKNGICIHEEDYGILWKHWDFRTDRTQVRRSRRLVISSISTVGNYEYGCYWYFYLDGEIEFEMKATGIINTAACIPGQPDKYETEVSPGVVGQIHQHHFCARLDMSVDGDENTVLECDTVAEPMGPENPYGNAYYVKATELEKECGRTRNPETERFWKFINPNKKNPIGQPTGYKLAPTNSVRLFTDPNSPSGKRMAWVNNHLWVTAYDPEERYPAGEFVNQSDCTDGLTAFVEKGRNVKNADLVAWHTFGLHHPVRPEDFPVQNCVNTGFKLMPTGFFGQNPNMDLPDEKNQASAYVEDNGSSCCS